MYTQAEPCYTQPAARLNSFGRVVTAPAPFGRSNWSGAGAGLLVASGITSSHAIFSAGAISSAAHMMIQIHSARQREMEHICFEQYSAEEGYRQEQEAGGRCKRGRRAARP
jgi:hypothetical protein